jgi:ankyrin repeat protein
MAHPIDPETSLYSACRDRNSSINEIRRLIDADPKALTKQNGAGQTPVHMAYVYLNQSTQILHCLLDRCPPEVIGMRNILGYTPLHIACIHGVSIEIIRRMILMYPKALRMMTKSGETALHMACSSPFTSLNVIRYLASECPIVCLLNNNVGRTPYHESVQFGRSSVAILDVLAAATKQAALALLVFVDSAMINVPPAVISHIQQVLPPFSTEGFSVSYCMSSNEPILQALNDPQTLNNLLNNNDLQKMLKDEDCQDMITIMLGLVKAGTGINDHARLDTKHHVGIIESVSAIPDCMYLHLRNNPTLCWRSTTTGRPAAAAAEQGDQTRGAQADSVNKETSNEASGRKRKAPSDG